jgi:hypothetical protein
MAGEATTRALQTDAAAKGKVAEKKCKDCASKKCDAKLPDDPTTRKVALTTFAEANATSNKSEFEAVASVMHNRVGNGWGNSVDKVLEKTYWDKRRKKRMYEFHGYQNDRYKKAERGDLEPGDCEALKKAIAAAEEVQKNGVPDAYKGYTFFADSRAVSDHSRGTLIGKTIFGTKPF